MSAGWLALGHSLRVLLETHGLAVIAVVLFLEELGLPIPIPGDLMMLLAGIRVAQGKDPLWLVLAVEEAATLAGASLLFAGSRRFGRDLVRRFGWLLHLGPETLARAEGQVTRHGGWAIVVARLIPGFRIVTVIAAGVLGLPYRAFLPALALGGFLYLLVYTLLGVFVGPIVLAFLERLAPPAVALLSLAVLVVFALVLRGLERANPAGKTPAPDARDGARVRPRRRAGGAAAGERRPRRRQLLRPRPRPHAGDVGGAGQRRAATALRLAGLPRPGDHPGGALRRARPGRAAPARPPGAGRGRAAGRDPPADRPAGRGRAGRPGERDQRHARRDRDHPLAGVRGGVGAPRAALRPPAPAARSRPASGRAS